MSEPLVSVIVPVHNGAAFLSETLESAFAQDHRPLEVLVIDDGSTDESSEIASTFEDVQLIRQENQGVATARNEGVRHARGDFLAFLDQDDVWEREKTTLQLARLREAPDLGFVLVLQNPLLVGDGPPPAWVRTGLLEDRARVYVPSSLMVRRTVFDFVGDFDVTLRSGHDDTDWFARAKDAGVDHEFVEKVLLRNRIHSEANSSRVEDSQKEMLKVLRAKLKRQR